MILDLSVVEQRYVEDCEVCCRPIELHYAAMAGELNEFRAARADD